MCHLQRRFCCHIHPSLPPTHMPRENAVATRNAIAVRMLPADIVVPGGTIPLLDPLPRWKCCLRRRDYRLPQQLTDHRSLPHGRNRSRVLLRQMSRGISDQWPVVKSRPSGSESSCPERELAGYTAPGRHPIRSGPNKTQFKVLYGEIIETDLASFSLSVSQLCARRCTP